MFVWSTEKSDLCAHVCACMCLFGGKEENPSKKENSSFKSSAFQHPARPQLKSVGTDFQAYICQEKRELLVRWSLGEK